MRNPLHINHTIILALDTDVGNTRAFTINEVLGCGSSCIAYRAFDVRSQLPVIVKECFPLKNAIRDENGTVTWNTADDKTLAQERFRRAFEVQRRIQSANDTMNPSTHLIDGLYAGNNTIYTVNDVEHAKTYNTVTDPTLQDIFKTAKAVAQAINKYHAKGYLHLDIKPQNILILPETREIVKLLDFDSIVKKSDVLRLGAAVSYTHEYAAPELLQGKRGTLCEATDVYAIGAVIFSKISGCPPSAEDRGTFSDWNLSGNTLFSKLSSKVRRLTKELLRKTLSASIHKRCDSADELISLLDELIIESDPRRRFMNSTYAPSRNFFIGRNAELNQIHTAFSSGVRVVFIDGIGGIGKTELAFRYAEQYRAFYDVIAFGRYSDSLDSLFRSPDFISIENDTDGMPSINAIRSLVSERTLLVIDDFDNGSDCLLDAVLSLECNLLLTSRYSFEETFGNDVTSVHINVAELPLQEQLALFERDCGHELTEEEIDVTQDILQEISGHTLLIPLIAKSYKNDEFTLQEILRRIHDAGVEGASNIELLHHKDTTLSGTAYAILREVLNMAGLSADEIHVMRSLALLGGIVIDRKEFNTWLGGQHKNAVNSLSKKSWVQLTGTGPNAKLSMHKVISGLARREHSPNLNNCIWAKKLCNSIVNELRHTESAADPNTWYDLDDTQRARITMTAKLLLSILTNLDYSQAENISYYVSALSSIIDDSIDRIDHLQFIDESLLRQIITSAQFHNTGIDTQFNTYCLLHNNCLAILRNKTIMGLIPRRINGIIEEMTESLLNAESLLADLSEQEKSPYMLRLIAISTHYICTRGAASIGFGWHTDNYDSFDKHIRHILDIFGRTPVPNELLGSIIEKRDKFMSEFESETMINRLNHAIFGYANEEDEEAAAIYDMEYGNKEVEQYYCEFFDNNTPIEELNGSISKLFSDQRFPQKKKIMFLVRLVEAEGFDPFLIDTNLEGLRFLCLNNENQSRAKKYVDYLANLAETDEAFDEIHGSFFFAQAVLLACCFDDNEAVDRYIRKYYSCEPAGTSTDLYYALLSLGFSESAKKLVNYGIDKLEKDVKISHVSETSLYKLYGTIADLAECINDNRKASHYRNMQRESLRLGFVIE